MASDEDTTRWAEYDRLIGLHKFYFEYLLKAAGFSFGLIGAILVYVIDANLKNNEHPWIALALPNLMSLGTCIVFCLAVWKTADFSAKVHEAQIRLGMPWRPHAEVLVWMSVLFAALFLVVFIGLVVLSLHPQLLPEARHRA
jgi:hypothetical protein